ncbi:MAG: PilZ domain-containing protein [Deltaproteobacteria bacterium]|nr:PilZ domain-containing protein [Deltaproteobacteria bacterium]
METKERRRHARLLRSATITCQPVTYPLGRAAESQVRMLDVSEGGVRLDAPTPFDLGSLLQVALLLDGWNRHATGRLRRDDDAGTKPLTALGRVARCEPAEAGRYEVGVQFLDIWDEHWQAMRRYLQGAATRLQASQPEGFGDEQDA